MLSLLYLVPTEIAVKRNPEFLYEKKFTKRRMVPSIKHEDYIARCFCKKELLYVNMRFLLQIYNRKV